MNKKSQYQGTEENLEAIREQLLGLVDKGINVPDSILLSNNPQLMQAEYQRLLEETEAISDATDQLADAAEDVYEKQLAEMDELESLETTLASAKPFNLKKAQMEDFPVEDIDPENEDVDLLNDLEMDDEFITEEAEEQDDYIQQISPSSVSEFVEEYLDVLDQRTARYELMKYMPEELKEATDKVLQRYYETDWETEDDPITKKIKMVYPLWENMVAKPKAQPAQEGVMENVDLETVSKVKDFVLKTNAQIEKLAKSDLNKKQAKTFNLKKEAQHKTVNNMFMWGPENKRFDPFLRQPVSDWHIVERNKGYGFTVGDIFNIDWEAIWRGNIMDKYSRPYRDTKTGDWVGGYIHKRFEVDKWIPDENNIQLLPGQKRKPYIPEKRSLESRMVAQREKEAEEKGWEPAPEQDKPFNWKKASKKKS